MYCAAANPWAADAVYHLAALSHVGESWGSGAEARRPLGLAVVGGLLVSQTLTLYVTPVFYVYMERLRSSFGRSRVKEPALAGLEAQHAGK